jgi:uncharacterized membrane protein YedE/YeeE
MLLFGRCSEPWLTVRSAVMAIMEGLKVAHCPPRKASTIGWFSNYDANIIGGAMVGAGMTLTGACPGTVLVQLSSGVRSGWLVLLGGVLGGILWTRMSPYIRKDVPSNSATSASHTIYSKFNLSQNSVILAYEAACLGMITLATSLGPKGAYVPLHPVLGGLLIGGAQAASLMMTGSPLGVSTTYEEIGQSFWRMWDSLFGSKPVQTPPPSTRAIKFALGILVGSYALLQSTASARVATNMQVPAVPAVLGGCIMVVGARLAGGCTSGHGITGMALLSISSIITVASMFAGGIALAQVLA